jgi:hypothetical protein
MATSLAPRRILAAAALIDSLGDGLYLAGSALFFTRGLGLPVTQVGLGLSIAGIIGLLIGAEIGRLADRFGPREVFATLMLLQTLAVAGYVLVTGVVSLIAAATVAAVCRQGAQASRGAMIGQIGGDDAATLRSYLHAVINVGIAGGAALAGLALAKDTHAAYVTLMLADAATFTIAAVIALLLPATQAASRTVGKSRRLALSDRRFVELTALSGVLSLQFVISGYLLPLWVVLHTDAPRWLASPLLLLNTALIVAFQVRVSTKYKGLHRAAVAVRVAGALLALACVVFGTAHYSHSSLLAAGVLLTAMTIASVAELFFTTAAFGISFGLAPVHAVGEYQGVWNLGFGTSVALGPGLLTLVVLEGGPVGWYALGAVLLVTALVMGRVTTGAAIAAEPSQSVADRIAVQ